MAKIKTRKSITKRFKLTKTGKILRRATGLSHYRAKKSGQTKRRTRKFVELSKPESKKIRKYLS
ncbi:MAG: 50S ribosomal protein L35 [Patescibacteria group bacterium]|nr:50S ribosomal protein L35 [Patescibacteria group bacterium]